MSFHPTQEKEGKYNNINLHKTGWIVTCNILQGFTVERLQCPRGPGFSEMKKIDVIMEYGSIVAAETKQYVAKSVSWP